MIKPYYLPTALALLAASAVLPLAGCSSSARGANQASQTAGNMDRYVASLEAAKVQIDKTIAALDAIEPATDRLAAYKTYVQEVNKTKAMADRARKRSYEMRRRGAEYFRTWTVQSATISNPELRATAEARRSKVEASFDAIKVSSDKAKDSYESLMESLYDIQLFLGSDLTEAGLQAVSGYKRSAATDAAAVDKALDEIITEVGKVRELLVPGSGQPPAAGGDASASAPDQSSP